MSKKKPTGKQADRKPQFTFAPDDDVREAFLKFVNDQEITPERTAALNYLLRHALREKYPAMFEKKAN